MDKEKLKQLKRYGHYYSVPRGSSMFPMLLHMNSVVDIVPCKERLKKYDVALYWNDQVKKYVLHRVVDTSFSNYTFCGDNCWQKEIVPEDRVMGVAVQFKRKHNGRWISVNSLCYRCYVRLWCDFLFIRRCVFWMRDRVK